MEQETLTPEPDPERLTKEDEDRVEQALTVLYEHFEAIRIFVCRPSRADELLTASLSRGRGNWFAQYGMVKEWVVKQEAETKKSVYHSED